MVNLLVLACLLISQFSFSQTSAQTAKAGPKTPNAYADEAFVIEQVRNSYRFENDGTGQQESYARIRVQSEAGVKLWGQVAVGYNSANESLNIPYVRVLKKDGGTITAPADAIQDLSSPIEREAPVYTDFRQKHITVPALRPGDTLEYDFVRVVHTPLAAGQFWMEHNFDTQNIVLDEQLEVTVPSGRIIKLKNKSGVEPKLSEVEGRRRYQWASKHLEKEDSAKSSKAKTKKPNKQVSEAPAIQLSSFQTWEEVGRWYAGLERERRQPTPEIKTKADELTRGLTSDLDKTEALYDYVAKNFRYVSLSLGLGRYQPHNATDVLRNQYGDCKDKHTLLASLLAAEGISASSVLIGSTRKLDADVPSPAQFDHVITVATVGSERVWMDTTTEVAPFRLLLAPLRDKDALEIPPGDGARIVKTPVDTPMPGFQTVDLDGEVDELGKLSATVHLQARGDVELLMRMIFRRVPSSGWQQVLQRASAIWGVAGDVSDVHVSDPERTRVPFEITYKLTEADYFDSSKKSLEIAVPLSAIMAITTPEESDSASSDPIKLGPRMRISSQVKLKLPPKCSAVSPVPIALKRDYAEYSSLYKVEAGVFSSQRSIVVQTTEIPADRLQDYIAFQHAIAADLDQHFSVENFSAGSASSVNLSADDLHESGVAALDRQNYTLAIDLLKRAVAADPKHKSAWNNLGRAYLAMRQYDDAITAFQKQIELNAYDEFAYNNLGRAYWFQRKYDPAVAAFQKQLEINPLDKYAHANLGALYLEWKKYDLAAAELEKASAIESQNAFLQVNAGKAYLNLGQDEKAIAAFDKATNLSATPVVWNDIAYELSLKKSHLARALQLAQSAVQATEASLRNLSLEQLQMRDVYAVNSLVAYWDTLGWVYFAMDELIPAEKYVTAAWIVGQHADIGNHLAQIYERKGQKERAVQAYAEALNGVRPDPEIKDRLVALAGTEKASLAIEKNRLGLQNTRTIKLGRVARHTGTAEFFVLLEAAGSDAVVSAAKYVSGDEQLKDLTENLKRVKYPLAFPDEASTKILRRGVASCSTATGECLFVMAAPADVRSVD